MESRETKASATAPAGSIAPSAFAGRATSAPRRPDDLHVCPACAAELVYPTDWGPASGGRWAVELRCPDCRWTGGGVFAQPVVDRFEDVLDRGTEAVIADLQALARANMEEEIELFVEALEAELVVPEDF